MKRRNVAVTRFFEVRILENLSTVICLADASLAGAWREDDFVLRNIKLLSGFCNLLSIARFYRSPERPFRLPAFRQLLVLFLERRDYPGRV